MATLFDPRHILALVRSVVWLSTWLAVIAVIFVPFEWLFALRPRKTLHRGLAQDLGYYFINGLVPAMLLAVPLSIVAIGSHALIPDRLHAAVAAWPLWQRVLAGLVVGEIGFYWGHRWAHEIPFLWRFHAIHHAPEHVYFLTSAHAHPIDNVFIRLCGMIPAYVLGVASPLSPTGSVVPTLIVLIATIWGFFIHANVRVRLGPLAWLISTPQFHHWHHTLAEPRDRNFASMLPWMDRIFGTYHAPAKHWPQAYGIDAALPTSLGGQLLYPIAPRRRADVPATASAAGTNGT